MLLPSGVLKKIFVKSVFVKKNKNNKVKRPVIGIWTPNGEHEGYRVEINGPSSVIYSVKEMFTHAHIWVETMAEVELITEYNQAIEDIK